MTSPPGASPGSEKAELTARTALASSLLAFLEASFDTPAADLTLIVDEAARAFGAESALLHVADYGLLALRPLGSHDQDGRVLALEGTLAGRSFAAGEVVTAGDRPTTVWIPLTEGAERLGVLELTYLTWDDELRRHLAPLVTLLVMLLVGKRRYTDVFLRSRRARPLSIAAEIQWDLLPPLTASTPQVAVSGFLEPAYEVGGDSFDYALNPNQLDFAIIDAVGRAMPAALVSVAAINTLRNVRRERGDLAQSYRETDRVIQEQFGLSQFVTAQLGSLALNTGEMTWLNAGHPLPLLVRSGSFIGELACTPSMPIGLGGPVVHIATESLEPGDRVLFYTDGVTESRAPDGEEFGTARLADHLVRATLDKVTPAETVRRLSASITRHNEGEPKDDATLLLVEYRPTPGAVESEHERAL